MTKFFSKSGQSCVDLEPINLKAVLVRGIIIPNIYVVILKSTDKCRHHSDDIFFFCFFFFFFFFLLFFSKNSYSYLEPINLKVELARDILTPNIIV